MAIKLILIRHLQTDYNLKKRYCGFTDIGLNKNGRLEAKKLREELKCLNPEKVYCSDLKRGRQTAGLIFGKNYPVEKRQSLREINFGEWEGLNHAQILKKYPLLYPKWLNNPYEADIPAGEKTKDFSRRIKKEFEYIIKTNPHKLVAVITHLGVLRLILNTILKIEKKDFWKLKLNSQKTAKHHFFKLQCSLINGEIEGSFLL